jgi:hypothetical protein
MTPVHDEGVPDGHGDIEPLSDGLLRHLGIDLGHEGLGEVEERLGDLACGKLGRGHGR